MLATRPLVGRAVFTIVERKSGFAYSLRQEKMAVVAFKHHSDAVSMSLALEHYVVSNGAYPPFDLDENPNALESIGPAPGGQKKTTQLDTHRWHSIDELVNACQLNSLNVLFCEAVELRPHAAFAGHIFDTGVPTTFELARSFDRRLG